MWIYLKNVNIYFAFIVSVVGVSPQGFDYRNMMDPEPGRCRRTDGKKWRCSKNVIPDQKYCEQHMHRGCRRSRKPVESSQITLPDSPLPKNSNKVSENSKNLSAPVSFQCINPSSCNTSTSHETTAMDSNNVCSIRNSISTNAATSSTIITATNYNKNDCKRNKNSPNISGKGVEKLSVSDNNIINRSSKSGNKAIVGNSISPGVGFSPKSVLQGSTIKTEIMLLLYYSYHLPLSGILLLPFWFGYKNRCVINSKMLGCMKFFTITIVTSACTIWIESVLITLCCYAQHWT